MKAFTLSIAALAFAGAAIAQDAPVVEDTDGNGTYSMEELLSVYPDLTAETFTSIDANADAGGRRHAVAKCTNVIFVEYHRFFISALAFRHLIYEPVILLFRVVKLTKAVSHFHTVDEQLETFGDLRILRRRF